MSPTDARTASPDAPSAAGVAAAPQLTARAPRRVAGVRVDHADAHRLAAAFDHCRAIAKARARNFYYGLRLTPEPRRSAIYAVYAWMRAADDIADAPGDTAGRRHRLDEFAAATRAALAAPDFAPGDPTLLAFATTVRAYDLDPAWFADVILGLQGDLDAAPMPDDPALTTYCYRVAGTVGLSCVGIWGLRPGADPDRAAELAKIQGQAFQRTNILRDFAEDFDLSPSRVYLPLDAFARHGITPDILRAWSSPAACERFVLEQATIARNAYQQAAPLRAIIDPACAPTLWAMTEIYSGILAAIERSPRAIVGPRRVGLSAARKAAIAAQAVLGVGAAR